MTRQHLEKIEAALQTHSGLHIKYAGLCEELDTKTARKSALEKDINGDNAEELYRLTVDLTSLPNRIEAVREAGMDATHHLIAAAKSAIPSVTEVINKKEADMRAEVFKAIMPFCVSQQEANYIIERFSKIHDINFLARQLEDYLFRSDFENFVLPAIKQVVEIFKTSLAAEETSEPAEPTTETQTPAENTLQPI